MNNRINEIRIYTAHNGNSIIRFIRYSNKSYPYDVILKSYVIESLDQNKPDRKFRLERIVRRLLQLPYYASEIRLDCYFYDKKSNTASNGIVLCIYPLRKG